MKDQAEHVAASNRKKNQKTKNERRKKTSDDERERRRSKFENHLQATRTNPVISVDCFSFFLFCPPIEDEVRIPVIVFYRIFGNFVDIKY